jgi:hypothetical protein
VNVFFITDMTDMQVDRQTGRQFKVLRGCTYHPYIPSSMYRGVGVGQILTIDESHKGGGDKRYMTV